MLVAGCRHGAHSAAAAQFHPPIAVTSCVVADSASALLFRDATGKLFTLSYDEDLLEGDALSLAVGSRCGVGSPLTPNSRIAQQLGDALQAFVDSKSTPAQIQDLKRRATLEEELEAITEDEWTLLETVSFTYRLKRSSANKAMDATSL